MPNGGAYETEMNFLWYHFVMPWPPPLLGEKKNRYYSHFHDAGDYDAPDELFFVVVIQLLLCSVTSNYGAFLSAVRSVIIGWTTCR